MAFIPKYILILAVTLRWITLPAGLEKFEDKKTLGAGRKHSHQHWHAGIFQYFNLRMKIWRRWQTSSAGIIHPQSFDHSPHWFVLHTFQSLSYTIEVYRGRQKRNATLAIWRST